MQTHFLLLLFFFEFFFACQQGLEKPVANSEMTGKPNLEEFLDPAAEHLLSQSADGGQTWENITEGLPQNVQPMSFFAGDGIVWLGVSNGLYRRSGNPAAPAWEKEIFMNESITAIFPGQAGPNVIVNGSGFFKRQPGTGLWMPMHQNLKDKTVQAIWETPNGALLVGCSSGIFKSADFGKTWQRVFNEGAVTKFAGANGVLIASSPRGVLRSTDGGENWGWVLSGNGENWDWSLRGREAIHIRHIGEGFVAILNGKQVVGGEKTNLLFISTDNGASWKRMGEPLPPALRSMYDLEQAGKYLFSCSNSGIFRSDDLGKTWEFVRAVPSNPGTFIRLLASGRVLFALRTTGC